MKMLMGFLIVCNCYAMHNNPLIHGLPSYYAPQMIKAIKKEDRNEVIRLYKLDPKLITVLEKKAQENNPWVRAVFNDVKKIEEEMSRRYKQEDDSSFTNIQHGKFEIHKGTIIPAKTAQTQTNVRARL